MQQLTQKLFTIINEEGKEAHEAGHLEAILPKKLVQIVLFLSGQLCHSCTVVLQGCGEEER